MHNSRPPEEAKIQYSFIHESLKHKGVLTALTGVHRLS
jgi:hypothetical protein